MKTSLVFVDDEQKALRRLERTTNPMRDRWERQFFVDCEHALTFIRTHNVDVVVSDISLGAVDGVDFLQLVREVQPASARLLIAGFEDEARVFGATRVAHQFLSKPCDVRELETIVGRLEEAARPTHPDVIRDLVGGIDELPALGRVYNELVAAIESDASSSESLGQIVSQDVALTAQLLRLINSSYFGLSAEITSVAHAIGFLGFDVVRAIVIGHSLFDDASNQIIDLGAVGSRARLAAALARCSVQRDGGSAVLAAEAFLAGMLHEVGVLVLSRLDMRPDHLHLILSGDDLRIERLEFGADRFDVGGHLLAMWGFTPNLVRAAAGLSDSSTGGETEVSRAVQLARRIVASSLDLTGELTQDQLSLLLDAAETDALGDFSWETDAA